MMPGVTAESPLRPITEDEVEAFRSDGVVCLRQVIPTPWLDRMAEAVERALADPLTVDLSQMGVDLAAGMGTETLLDDAVGDSSTPGGFRAGTQHWRRDADFDAFARTSPLPRIVARLLDSATIQLYEDSVLVKEPGTAERTAFHQDMAYFHVEGDQVCTTWVPLDPVTSASGALEFVRGSHRWRRTFRPNLFVTTMALPDTEGEEVPDPRTQRDWELVSFDTEPGDITVHHARTIHGAGGNASATVRRRAISVRYTGDDVRFRRRRGAPLEPHHEAMRDGDLLDRDAFPQVIGAG
jgi:ectoine hydroxylase-related dioxygenase (phytanoyl-CoA dioxygenase family)